MSFQVGIGSLGGTVIQPAARFYAASQEFVDTQVSLSRSLKFFCFGAVSIFQICYGTCQSIGEGISETANMKKILETSCRKDLNQLNTIIS